MPCPLSKSWQHQDGDFGDDIANYLGKVADGAACTDYPGGCFVVNSLIDFSNCSTEQKLLLQKLGERRTRALITRIERAKAVGDIPSEQDSQGLADFISGQAIAIAVMARSGAEIAAISPLIEIAMTAIKPGQQSR